MTHKSEREFGAHLSELAFWNSIPVENDPGGFVAGWLVELDEQFPHHGGQVLDNLLPWPLDPHSGTVPAGVGIHTAYHLEERGEEQWSTVDVKYRHDKFIDFSNRSGGKWGRHSLLRLKASFHLQQVDV